MRLLVVLVSPPCSTRSRCPYLRMHPHPPGPGLPRQHSPVKIVTCHSCSCPLLPVERTVTAQRPCAPVPSRQLPPCRRPSLPCLLKLARVNAPLAACWMTSPSVRFIVPLTRAASRNRRRRKLTQIVSAVCLRVPDALPLLCDSDPGQPALRPLVTRHAFLSESTYEQPELSIGVVFFSFLSTWLSKLKFLNPRSDSRTLSCQKVFENWFTSGGLPFPEPVSQTRHVPGRALVPGL
jgi:hypothetical protein